MKILKIVWLEESIGEAILTIGDGDQILEAFYDEDCPYQEGDIFAGRLHALMPEGFTRVGTKKSYFKKIDNAFGHEVLARVVDSTSQKVSVGNFIIELGGKLPPDIRDGEHILFKVTRIDAY